MALPSNDKQSDSLSSSLLSPSSSVSDKEINWEKILCEYDSNNDGNIDWNEFCLMCREKKIDDKQRDQVFKILGGEPGNIKSKIAIKKIKVLFVYSFMIKCIKYI